MDYEKNKQVPKRKVRIKLSQNQKEVLSYITNQSPEFRESEDEKVRKALIDYFEDAIKADENPLQRYGIHTDEVIYWLENQKPICSGRM